MTTLSHAVPKSTALRDVARGLKSRAEDLDLPGLYALAAGYCRVSGIANGLPVPPRDLTFLVSGHHNVVRSLRNGRLGGESVVATLARHGLTIDSFPAILDFGCGSGRVLRCWKGLEGVSIHATDYNPRLVEWSRAAFPFARVGVNGSAPPLDYPSDTFSFVYALSVFTHLDLTMQGRWVDELHRVIAPGGYLLLSLQGAASASLALDERERERYDRGEMVIKRGDLSGANECAVYHPPAYVRDFLAPGFTMIDHVPEGAKGNPPQDYYLFRKPAAPTVPGRAGA